MTVRLEDVARDVALDLGAVAVGQRARILVAAAHRRDHAQRGRIESRGHFGPVHLDLEPLDAQLQVVSDAGENAFTKSEDFARACTRSETGHTHFTLSDLGLDRIVGIA